MQVPLPGEPIFRNWFWKLGARGRENRWAHAGGTAGPHTKLLETGAGEPAGAAEANQSILEIVSIPVCGGLAVF